jgi:hypothetical protein
LFALPRLLDVFTVMVWELVATWVRETQRRKIVKHGRGVFRNGDHQGNRVLGDLESKSEESAARRFTLCKRNEIGQLTEVGSQLQSQDASSRSLSVGDHSTENLSPLVKLSAGC